MYARLQTIRAIPDSPRAAEFLDRLVETIAGHPGFAGVYVLEQIGIERGTLLTLWDTEEDARLAPERTAAVLGPRPVELEIDNIYEVDGDALGADGGAAGAASLLWFDGPLGEVMLAAARRAGTERIAPAMTPVPGFVRVVSLWDPSSRSSVVAIFATTLEALDQLHRAATSTELLPGEDPALLPGPDRVDMHRVVLHQRTAVLANR